MSQMRSCSRLVFTACFACALLAQRPALAIVAPWALSEPLPDVGVGNPLSALRVHVGGFQHSIPAIPNPSDPPVDVQSLNDTGPLPTTSMSDSLRSSRNVSSLSSTTISEAAMTGTA